MWQSPLPQKAHENVTDYASRLAENLQWAENFQNPRRAIFFSGTLCKSTKPTIYRLASYKYQQLTRAAQNYSEKTEPKDRCDLDERRRRHNFAQKSEAIARMHRPYAHLAPL